MKLSELTLEEQDIIIEENLHTAIPAFVPYLNDVDDFTVLTQAGWAFLNGFRVKQMKHSTKEIIQMVKNYGSMISQITEDRMSKNDYSYIRKQEAAEDILIDIEQLLEGK